MGFPRRRLGRLERRFPFVYLRNCRHLPGAIDGDWTFCQSAKQLLRSRYYEPIAPPTAHFIISVNDLNVVFMSAAIGEDLEYSWDFGDGNTSTEKDPAHTYLAGGSYTVIHSVSNEGGATSYQELVTVSEAYQPVAAADEKIAFTSDRDGNNEIYMMDSDGANAVNLTNHPSSDRHPAWSPDGNLIAFASRRDDNVFDIYLLDVENRAVTRLTNQGSNTRPAWSPDGARIAFVSDRYGDKDVMVMNADGSRQIQLTFDVHADDQPNWSPDGSAIAFVSDLEGKRNIYVISSADGSEMLTLIQRRFRQFSAELDG